jgi:hypothetical protein
MADDICVSNNLSGKMARISAISLNPLTNDFCNTVANVNHTTCSVCYARRYASTFRKNVIPPYTQNSKILSTREVTRDDFKKNAFKAGQYVRFLAYGELINEMTFKNFCTIARLFPDIKATMWTKRLDIVTPLLDLVPENLRLIYSTVPINPTADLAARIPDGFNGVFNVYTVDYIQNHDISINCIGSCATCLNCYTQDNLVVNELLKERWGNEDKRYQTIKANCMTDEVTS